MLNVVLTFVALFLTFDLLYTQAPKPNANAISKELQRVLSEEKLAGAVWSIVDSNGQILTGAVGYKNLKTKALMRPEDRVSVGSITKTVVSLGILRLISQKKIGLDDAVEKILPNIHFQNAWQATNPVTVRHLLDHRAGLEDVRLWQMFSAEARPNTPLQAAFERDTTVLHVFAPPGTVFSYSNIGFTVLGMVIEAVSGMKYEVYLDSEILAPLGMTRSTAHFVTQTGANADSTLALGHLENGETAPAMPMYLRPAGQLTTTAHDIAVLMSFLMSNGTINGQEFIALELLKQMGQQRESPAAKRGLEIGYSLGVGKRDRNGVTALFHTGAIVGYNAMMQFFPATRCGFFISHNMDSETAQYERSNQVLLAHLPVKPRQNKPVPQNPQELSTFDGYYTRIFSKYSRFALLDELTTITRARFEGNRVYLEPLQGKTKTLTYLGQGLFQMQDRTIASHAFYQTESGDFLISDSNTTIKKTSLLRLVALWTSLLAGLLGIVLVLGLGVIHLAKYRTRAWKSAIAPAFGAVCAFLVPAVLFSFVPYTQWGDLTAASGSLYAATLLLPSACVASLLCLWQESGKQHWREFFTKPVSLLSLFALAMILQMCSMLGSWGMMPFSLWQ